MLPAPDIPYLACACRIDVSRDVPETSDGAQFRGVDSNLGPTVENGADPRFSGQPSRQALDPRRPIEMPSQGMARVQPNGGPPAMLPEQFPAQDMGMQPPSEAPVLDGPSPDATAAQLPQGLNLKGISELAALFGIGPGQSAPQPSGPHVPSSFAQQAPAGIVGPAVVQDGVQQMPNIGLPQLNAGAGGMLSDPHPELSGEPESQQRQAMGSVHQPGVGGFQAPRQGAEPAV